MSLKMNYVPSSKDLAKSPTSKSLPAKVADSFNSFNAMPLRWPSTKCKVIPSETPVFVFLGADPRITLAQPGHLTDLLPHPPSIPTWDSPLNTNSVHSQQ